MIKKKIYGSTLKKQLIVSAKDRLYNFMLAHGTVRGVIIHGTLMVNGMRANHELGILETLIHEVFEKYSPTFLANRRVEFMCHCTKERLRTALTMLPIEDLKDILEKGPFPLEMRCHHCNTPYLFGKAYIKKIYGKRFPNN